MKNMINFKTADRPSITRSCKFPYETVLNALKVLDSTKSIVFDEDEIKQGNVYLLRKFAGQLGVGYVRRARIDGKIHLWLTKDKLEGK